MRNGNHPLIKALGSKKNEEPKFHLPEIKRMIDVHHHEIPELKRMKPGDRIRLEVHGKIKSMHDDGRSMIEVHQINNDDESQEAKQDSEKKTPIVMTQESHVPS